ncbi:MAG: HEAT repeat domain-containing protein [Planctomycetes bacterium]|nr:HEAT repeat domain-containing protein [Planctomycetota bacterium]
MMSPRNKAATLGLLFFSFLSLTLLCTPAVAEDNRVAKYTFAKRGEEIGRLYRLGLENDPEHIKIFCDALQSPEQKVREAAAAQLVFTHDESALETLVAVQRDPSTLVRRCAIAVFGKVGGPKAIAALKDQLTYIPEIYLAKNNNELPIPREEYFNRLAAAQALSRLGDPTGKEVVVEILRTVDDSRVLTMALNAATIMEIKAAIPEAMRIAQACIYFGEDTAGLFAMRTLRIIGDESWAEKLTTLALEKFEAQANYVKMESLGILAKWGDRRGLPLMQKVIAETTNSQFRFWAVKGLQRLRPEGAAEFLAQNFFKIEERFNSNHNELLDFKVACEAIAGFGDPTVADHLDQLYQQTAKPFDYFTHRLYLAWSLAALGDPRGLGYLQQALTHEDAAVRRLGAKFLGRLQYEESAPLLLQALQQETEPYTFKVMQSALACFGPLPAEAEQLTAPLPPPPPETSTEPRYMLMFFDDCATVDAMERFTRLMEELAKQGSRWVFTMYFAPLSRHDYEYNTVLVQRCFDRGCEIENHTLHHNPELKGVQASTDDEIREEIVGCNQWLHTHIQGLDKIYSWKAGGGGTHRPGDPSRSMEEVNRIAAEGDFATDVHYRRHEYNHGVRRTLWAEITAPPVHLAEGELYRMLRRDRTELAEKNYVVGLRPASDLYGAFDFDTAEEGVEAYVASFDHWYYNSPDKLFVVGGHDFPASPVLYRAGFGKRWEIQEGLLQHVLQTHKAQYPHLYSVTTLELSYILYGGADLNQLLKRTSNLQTRAGNPGKATQ